MTVKDKLEIGLKEDAPYRKHNVPPEQQPEGLPDTKPNDPTRSPEVPGARAAADASARRAKAVAGTRSTRKRPPKPVRKARKSVSTSRPAKRRR